MLLLLTVWAGPRSTAWHLVAQQAPFFYIFGVFCMLEWCGAFDDWPLVVFVQLVDLKSIRCPS